MQADATFGRKFVASIFGDLTIPKADVRLGLADGSTRLVSVKKAESRGGQAHLSTLDRFLRGVAFVFKAEMPEQAVWCLRAFLGETAGVPIRDFAPGVHLGAALIRGIPAEDYQNRLYASTLRDNYLDEWMILSSWLDANMAELTALVFSTGYTRDPENWADTLFVGSGNRFVATNSLAANAGAIGIRLRESGRFAGSTILFPWGFLQAHRPGRDSGPYQLQFHHEDARILDLVGRG
jgi:hypothetical protein